MSCRRVRRGSPNTRTVTRYFSHLVRSLNLAPPMQEVIDMPYCGLPGHLTGNLFGRSLRNMAPPTEGGPKEVPIEKFLAPLVPFCS
jgi:hypothetical protein